LATAVLEGGPARIDSDRYQISAKAGDAVSKEMMNGPMLRALLEERFRSARIIPCATAVSSRNKDENDMRQYL
jgi:hypothetical protein